MVELRCGVQCGPGGNNVRLGGLPNLRRCRLIMVPRRNSRNGVPVTLDAASLAGLQQLQVSAAACTAVEGETLVLVPCTCEVVLPTIHVAPGACSISGHNDSESIDLVNQQ